MPQKMKPIRQYRTTLADQAYQRLSDVMLSGAAAPGSRLVMDDIAEQLQISRTPVRDALLRLEHDGIVEHAGRRGYIVRELDSVDFNQIYQAREAVECYAAASVADLGAGRDAAIAHISKVIESVADTDLTDVRATYEANLRVHRVFVEVLDNPRLLELFDAQWKSAPGMSMFAFYMQSKKRHISIAKRHRPLIAALRKGSKTAFDAMQEHIRAGLEASR